MTDPDTGTSNRAIGVIPALDEASNIARVVADALLVLDEVVVADNGSSDETARIAAEAGAIVVTETRRGYGFACAAGSAEALAQEADIVVYMDGDGSSVPSEAERLLAPILADQADLVLGSRTLGQIEPGAMPPHQRLGNLISAWLMRAIYRIEVSDLGPFRAIRAQLLDELAMSEMTYGWPTEMTVKAAKREAVITEVPVTWRARGSGRSKVSGTVKGSILAARYIIGVTLRHAR